MFGLFSTNALERVALVDVSSSSVRAAYALIGKSAPVRIVYETKVPIEVEKTGGANTSMLRAVDAALRNLRSEGAPKLHALTGSGAAHQAFTSVCAPWQRATLRTVTKTEEKPFVVTEELIRNALTSEPVPEDKVRTEEAVVATLLNGYETHKPVGKHTERSEIIVLSSLMDKDTHTLIERGLGSFSESHKVSLASFSSVSFRALSTAFPHESDYLTLRVSGEATELSFVKRGFPLATIAVPIGIQSFMRAAHESGISVFSEPTKGEDIIDREKNEKLHRALLEIEQKWTEAFGDTLRGIASTHALPRTIFLLADEEARGLLARLIDAPELHTLWLSDEPLTVIPLDSKHFASLISRDTPFGGNTPIDLLALHARTLLYHTSLTQ
ncbi:MAG: hypothetical protein WBK28_01410 [Minisyncoccia bacterium]